MAGERYRHIFLQQPSRSIGFTNPRKGSSSPRFPDRDCLNHSSFLQNSFETVWSEAEHRQTTLHVDRKGVYIVFASEPDFDLTLQSLEGMRSGVRLLNVQKVPESGFERTLATVYVPHTKRAFFLNKIQAYANGPVEQGHKPKNAKLIDSISDVRRAVLESFWCGNDRTLIPGESPEWVEVWLSSDENEIIGRFNILLGELKIVSAEGVLKFPERSVKLIQANRSQLDQLIDLSDDVAEFRLAKEVATYFINLENQEQLEVARQLLDRCTFRNNANVAICILDTGVNNGHLLIQPVLHNEDLHTVRSGWGTNDDPQRGGHGTLMAGTATYGDLLELINSGNQVEINHCLESVKILPPLPTQNPKELWGHLTAQGVSIAEIQEPNRKRIICMAVTAPDCCDRGRPSSWSSAIDALASGYEDNVQRLIIISSGNVDNPDSWRNYPADNLTNEVHDPGQSWNALTVGAYTEKVQITDASLRNFSPIAPSGGLSPYSTTSTTWVGRKWPLKPEVLFEGGNIAQGPNDSVFEADDLRLLSTYHDPQIAQFAPFNATSAASAQASWMAAQIQEKYPAAWPETVRALIVHTAQWTDTMMTQFLRTNPQSKRDYANLLRICGYGVPDLERALYCATNSLTLISQAELQPFAKKNNRYITHAMHLYKLPWPSDVLSALGETQIEMRVTLSYFVEPGPGEIGWDNRYRYASHAFRFEVNGPSESEREFVRRVNDQARDDGEHPGTSGPGDRWVIGEARNVGSIHSDIWKGRAADLAGSNKIAVFPAVGWWRERNNLKRWDRKSRYTLVVSIHSPEENVDIYTPVAVQVGVPIPITITTEGT
ncbi:MAG: S8 family peptidase [Syntrophaceae bacterium]|nr:S8 family peptidase [Syntrophaceae bacterium]